jgi:hypothetical protein
MPLPHEPNLAIVGATGAVGRELLELLVQRRFMHGRLRLLASARSAGRWLPYCGTSIGVEAPAGPSVGSMRRGPSRPGRWSSTTPARSGWMMMFR